MAEHYGTSGCQSAVNWHVRSVTANSCTLCDRAERNHWSGCVLCVTNRVLDHLPHSPLPEQSTKEEVPLTKMAAMGEASSLAKGSPACDS